MSAPKKAPAKPRAKKAAAKPVEVFAIKGFDSNLQCLGYQYEVGKTYEHTGAVRLCSSGYHSIDGNPLDVLDYYPIIGGNGSLNRFCSVVASGEIGRESGTSKIVSGKLTVSVELTIPDLIRKSVAFVIDACKASKDKAVQSASGYSSKLAASGDYSQLAASGYSSKLAASGDSSKLAASGENSVIAAASPGCSATGADGTWISLAEFDRSGKCVGFATGCIGKGGLKANTAYVAKAGKLEATQATGAEA